MNEPEFIRDYTERYIYQVTRRLPRKGHTDIERELRGLITDMLDMGTTLFRAWRYRSPRED